MADLETDDERLAKALLSLSHPNRLRILRALRTPKALGEIRVVGPGRAGAHARPLARQSVRKHLDKLCRLSLVLSEDGEREYGSTTTYVLNQQRLFVISEEFRNLARLRASAEPGAATVQGSVLQAERRWARPCLVLVKGVEEGHAYPLTPGPAKDRWLIGRRRSADISLDYDPFVSSENSAIARVGPDFFLEDLATSRNGTSLNLQALQKGERVPLGSGDVVGVGRSLLVFRG